MDQAFAPLACHGTVSRKKVILKCVMKIEELKYLCSGCVGQLHFDGRSQNMVGMMSVQEL